MPNSENISKIQAHLEAGILFSPEIITFLQKSDSRIHFRTDDVPWFYYCLAEGNHIQRQQLAELDFLNKPFVAYYKQWGNSKSKISVASFHRDFYGKPCPSVKKSHTILTMLLRHAPEKYAAPNANDLIHELLSLKDAQGAAFVDIDRLFQHEENQQPTTYTQHSLISYLMELISLTKTPDNRKYHIGILRALLLNENPSFGNFFHNPSTTSYEHAILSNSYSLNTFTFAVGFSLPEVACFYGYIFPEAVCLIKHMYPHMKNEYCKAIYDQQKILPPRIASFGEIFTAARYKDMQVPTDIVLCILQHCQPDYDKTSTDGLKLTQSKLHNSIGCFLRSAPDKHLRQAANKCAQLTIQAWRYHTSLDNPLYVLWLDLKPLARSQIFEYISEIIYMTLQDGTNKIEDHLTESFRAHALRCYSTNESHPNLRSIATQLTTQFIEEILSCKGHIIVAPSLALVNMRTHKLAQDMFNTWLRQTTTNIQQLKELLFEFKLNKDRTNLLLYFLLSYNIQDSEHKTILAHWQRFTTPRTTQPQLNWPTLQKFIIEYAKLNPRHWELKAQ